MHAAHMLVFRLLRENFEVFTPQGQHVAPRLFAEISHQGSTHPLQISPIDAGVGCGPLETKNFQKF